MSMILAYKVKLKPTAEQHTLLEETLSQYKEAIDQPLIYGFQNKTTSGVELHKATYYPLRKSTQLPSQLVCSARCKATEILKSIKSKTKGKFNTKQPMSHKFPTIRFDFHTCKFTTTEVHLSTRIGRIAIPFVDYPLIHNHWKSIQKTCELMYKASRKEWYLIVFVEIQEPAPSTGGAVLGIDRGCTHIAVCSNNQFFDSKHLRNVKGRYDYLRKRLQNKGTKSAKKLLRKISGKENRFAKDTNHCLSKQIVALPFDTFVFEKLNIKRTKDKGKRFNSILNGWSYFQLEQFVKYKAHRLGKQVAYVDARYTSQKCSKCGHIEKSNRPSQSEFKCKACGFTLHADLNAARNIQQNFIAVSGIPSSGRALSNAQTNQFVAASAATD